MNGVPLPQEKAAACALTRGVVGADWVAWGLRAVGLGGRRRGEGAWGGVGVGWGAEGWPGGGPCTVTPNRTPPLPPTPNPTPMWTSTPTPTPNPTPM